MVQEAGRAAAHSVRLRRQFGAFGLHIVGPPPRRIMALVMHLANAGRGRTLTHSLSTCGTSSSARCGFSGSGLGSG